MPMRFRGNVAIGLACVLMLSGIDRPVVSNATVLPELSYETMYLDQAGTAKKVRILNTKKSYIKSLKIEVSNKSVVKITKKTRSSFRIVGKKVGKAHIHVKINLKKKKCGRKWYGRSLIVYVGKEEPKPTMSPEDIDKYSYEIIPLTDDIYSIFYVKTDNPDPMSFVITDEDTVYSDKAVDLRPCTTVFKDVVYEDENLGKVKGGYIFSGDGIDGGELKVRVAGRSYYDIGIGKTDKCPKLYSATDYLIEKYTEPSMSFFEKMDAVQIGLSKICLYNGAWVLGNWKKDPEKPYYGLTTSPHVDQEFWIVSPYNRDGNKSLLVSALYPFILDSVGYPNQLAKVAKTLEPSCICEKSPTSHADIYVTFNGEKKEYGGQGSFSGDGIYESMISDRYTFDGAPSDLSGMHSWSGLWSIIRKYQEMEIPKVTHEQEELTWETVKKTIGEGSYVRLIVYYGSGWGSEGIGYTYLFDDGNAYSEGVAHFSDTWYDGRYFNKYEYFEKGTRFTDKPKAKIALKDAVIRFPKDGKEYSCTLKDLNDNSVYDWTSGVMKGYTIFSYDDNTGNWTCKILNTSGYYDKENGKMVYKKLEDPEFVDDCTLTPAEVEQMRIDRNTDIDPTSFLIFDTTAAPGTRG